MTKISQFLNSIFNVYYDVPSPTLRLQDTQWQPPVPTCQERSWAAPSERRLSGSDVVVVFPKSKLTSAVIALEHPLWSFDGVQVYYNLEVVRGSLKYILCPGYTLNLPASLNLCTCVGHCPSRIPLKQFHFSSQVAEDTSGCRI